MKPLFTLGRVVATPGALAAIGVSGVDLSIYLARHQSGDWGEVDDQDWKENHISLEQGFRLMSVYTLSITGGQDLGDYRSRPFVYLYFAAGRILTSADRVKAALVPSA